MEQLISISENVKLQTFWWLKSYYILGLITVLTPLTFTKLRFWPPKKKTTKRPPKFCICGSFGPQCQFWLGLCWRDTL